MLRNPKTTPPKTPDVWVEVPTDYQKSARWTPRIGENFPNFAGLSTQGKITFHPYTAGNWTIFFSIAAAFSDTCSKELAGLASVYETCRRDGVNVIGIARNTVEELNQWCDQVALQSGQTINFPILSDPDGMLTSTFGMIHPHEEAETTIRKTIIINPLLKVSMLFEYPLYISRSTSEMMRTLEAARAFYGQAQDQLRGGRSLLRSVGGVPAW